MFLGALVRVLLNLHNHASKNSFLGTSADHVMKVVVQREAACPEKLSIFPRDCQQGIFSGPGGYHPTMR